MKKLFTLALCAAAVLTSAQATNYTTAGNGRPIILSKLADTEGSGVTRVGNVVTISDSLTIAAPDKFYLEDGLIVKMADKVAFTINGPADFQVDNGTTFTAVEGTKPYAISVWDKTQTTKLKNVTFDQVGFRGPGKAFEVTDCHFTNFNGANNNHGAFTMNNDGATYKFKNCTFEKCAFSAIIGAANYNTPVVIENCQFIKNGTKNRLYPQLNLTASDTVIVRGCTVVGDTTYLRVGGISVGNLLGNGGPLYTVIEGNTVTDNSYGIGITGPANVTIKNNIIKNNTRIAKATQGGSGISTSSTGADHPIVIEGNQIEGNLWGVTVIGNAKYHANVNLGKLDENAEDYNPGNNTFKNNGNGGVLYDLYNNSQDTVWAQGNTWNVATQDSASIETVITHKADNDALGLVIFMPAHQSTGITEAQVGEKQVESISYYDLMGRKSSEPREGISIKVTRFTDGTTQSEKLIKH